MVMICSNSVVQISKLQNLDNNKSNIYLDLPKRSLHSLPRELQITTKGKNKPFFSEFVSDFFLVIEGIAHAMAKSNIEFYFSRWLN